MQYSHEHLKTMVYAEFGGQTECIMGNWKIENWKKLPQSLNLPNGSRPYYKTKCENKIRPLTQRTTLFTTCTTPIMYLICPPKFCITFVFHFSWVLQPSSEKLKQCLCKMNNFAKRLSQKHKRYSDTHKQIQCDDPVAVHKTLNSVGLTPKILCCHHMKNKIGKKRKLWIDIGWKSITWDKKNSFNCNNDIVTFIIIPSLPNDSLFASSFFS